MASELEKVLSGKGKDTAASDSSKDDADKGKDPNAGKSSVDDDIKKKEEHKANLEKAIAESTEELRKIREAKAKESGKTSEGDEDLPRINLEDKNSKAWDKHIDKKVAPVAASEEKAKQEVRGFALRRFLANKPALSSDPEKVKKLMERYDVLAQAEGISERTQEGVISVLESAYGSLFASDVLRRAREAGVEAAKTDETLLDVATDTGASGYQPSSRENPRRRKLTAEEEQIAVRWYGSVENYHKAQEAAAAANS